MSRFRALYMAAVAVIGTGISGVVIVPKSHVRTIPPTVEVQTVDATPITEDFRLEAGKYVWHATTSELRGQFGQIFSRPPGGATASW
jgi:hypothetical protein